MKTNKELANEIVNNVKNEMNNTRIYEVEFTSKLPLNKCKNIIDIVKEILSVDFFVGDSKENNLIVWERNEKINQYIINNLI